MFFHLKPCNVLPWWLALWLGSLAGSTLHAQPAAAPHSVFMEDLTSPEMRARIAQGATTMLIPIGGTEQNGPHMVLGKHNVRVRSLSADIAKRLGNALVAPVIAYVPEGNVNPPAGHMRFAGTISISESAFESVLEGAARSFRQHGLRDIVLLGDHGGYQKSMARVAAKLNREWARDPSTRVHAVAQYYQVTQQGFVQTLQARGHALPEIGTHAGLADTSLAMAIDPALVRTDLLASGKKFSDAQGVYGDPRRSQAELGQLGIQQIIETSVQSIGDAMRTSRGH
ncbi:MAG: creatininase family protein [Rhodoferax sp.]|nr:creatininase family protein [Rhodoferax sp.]